MPAQPLWEQESRYEGIYMDEAEGIVQEFEQKMAEAVELLEGLNDSYLEAYIIARIQSSGEGNIWGSLPEQVRAHVLEEQS